MGYDTDFVGEFQADRPIDAETVALVNGINRTRRLARDTRIIGEQYGIEGEFYVVENEEKLGVFDQNTPPKTQPGLWCQWEILEDCQTIRWDGGEKFYHYVEWIKYLIERIFEPRGYKLSGSVNWYGEDRADMGMINLKENSGEVFGANIEYEKVWTFKMEEGKLNAKLV